MWFERLNLPIIFSFFRRSLQIGKKYLGLRPYDKYDTSVDQIELALFEFKSELILVPFLFRTIPSMVHRKSTKNIKTELWKSFLTQNQFESYASWHIQAIIDRLNTVIFANLTVKIYTEPSSSSILSWPDGLSPDNKVHWVSFSRIDW